MRAPLSAACVWALQTPLRMLTTRSSPRACAAATPGQPTRLTVHNFPPFGRFGKAFIYVSVFAGGIPGGAAQINQSRPKNAPGGACCAPFWCNDCLSASPGGCMLHPPQKNRGVHAARPGGAMIACLQPPGTECNTPPCFRLFVVCLGFWRGLQSRVFPRVLQLWVTPERGCCDR